jgi:hypothetical protein
MMELQLSGAIEHTIRLQIQETNQPWVLPIPAYLG